MTVRRRAFLKRLCAASGGEVSVLSAFRDGGPRMHAKSRGFCDGKWARELMMSMSVARNQRGALTQAGAGIAASRRKSARFRAAFCVSGLKPLLSGQGMTFKELSRCADCSLVRPPRRR